MLKYLVALVSVGLALWSGSEWLNSRLVQLVDVSQDLDRLLSQEELSLYNGREDSKGLYLAILGQVFDVEKGRKHYGPDGGYRFFTGISPKRSLILLFNGNTARGVVKVQNKKPRGWSWTWTWT